MVDLKNLRDEVSIGIVINHFGSTYYGLILDGICNLLIQNGQTPLVQPSFVSKDGEIRAIQNLMDVGCSGIILQSDALSDVQLEQLLVQHSKVVLVNRTIEGFEGRCVQLDNQYGAQLAASHLMNNGHKNVAMITGPSSKLREVASRTNAFVEEFSREGHAIPRELITEGDFSYESGIRGFRQLMSTQLPFTAIFAQNDSMAMGILEDCRQKGIRVPEDLSVVGFDDHHNLLKTSSPQLTTIRQPIEEIGRHAAQLMNELVAGDEDTIEIPTHHGTIAPVLIERDSVALISSKENVKHSQMAKKLTNREIECLQWIASGKTSGEIAIICEISESTVNYHLKNALTKLDSSNRAHAIAKAVHGGIITP